MKEILRAVIQMVGFVLLLPLLVACLVTFKGELLAIPLIKQTALCTGAAIFIAIFLFIYNFKTFFTFTINGISKLFAFTGPIGSGLGFIVPVYSIVIIIVYVILILLEKATGLETLFLSLISFLLAMHWVLTARHLYEEDNSILKAKYFLYYALLLISHLLIASLLLNWIISEFSSWSFLINSTQLAKLNYMQIYQFLFVDVMR